MRVGRADRQQGGEARVGKVGRESLGGDWGDWGFYFYDLEMRCGKLYEDIRYK